MEEQGKSGPGGLNIFFIVLFLGDGFNSFFPGAKVTGYINLPPFGYFLELGYPAERQKTNVDNGKRMT